jgi:hypothetical protein
MDSTMVDVLAVLDEIGRRAEVSVHGLDNGGANTGRAALTDIKNMAKDTARWVRDRYDEKES